MADDYLRPSPNWSGELIRVRAEPHESHPSRKPAMGPMPIDAVKAIQRDSGLCDSHVVHLADNAFTIAHTTAERAAPAPLHECDLHRWLVSRASAPHPLGLYVVERHQPDAYSEPYGADPWDFYPLKDDGEE